MVIRLCSNSGACSRVAGRGFLAKARAGAVQRLDLGAVAFEIGRMLVPVPPFPTLHKSDCLFARWDSAAASVVVVRLHAAPEFVLQICHLTFQI
jgi:hypothetical protein